MRHGRLDLLTSRVLLGPRSMHDLLPATAPVLVILPDELVSLSETSDDRWKSGESSRSGRVVGKRCESRGSWEERSGVEGCRDKVEGSDSERCTEELKLVSAEKQWRSQKWIDTHSNRPVDGRWVDRVTHRDITVGDFTLESLRCVVRDAVGRLGSLARHCICR